MKKLIVALTLVAILSAAAIGAVMAQDTDPENPETPLCPYCGGPGGTRSKGAGGGYLADYMHTAFADVLGITLDDFEARILAGETMYEIAETLGFDSESFADVHNLARAAALDLAYADGAMDEDQYQWMKERAASGFGTGFGGHAGGLGGGHGHGGQGGGCQGFQPAP